MSGTFWESICAWGGVPDRKLDKRGASTLKAANTEENKVPPIEILDSFAILVISPQEERVRNIVVLVVKSLPYELVLGAAYFGKHSSVL